VVVEVVVLLLVVLVVAFLVVEIFLFLIVPGVRGGGRFWPATREQPPARLQLRPRRDPYQVCATKHYCILSPGKMKMRDASTLPSQSIGIEGRCARQVRRAMPDLLRVPHGSRHLPVRTYRYASYLVCAPAVRLPTWGWRWHFTRRFCDVN